MQSVLVRRLGVLVALTLALCSPSLLGSAQAKPADKPAKAAHTKLKASAPKTTDALGAVTVTGKLTSKGEPVVGATVVLKVKGQGTKKFAPIAEAVTDDAGAVSFDVVQTKKHAIYKLAFAKTDTHKGSRSKAKSVKLAEPATS